MVVAPDAPEVLSHPPERLTLALTPALSLRLCPREDDEPGLAEGPAARIVAAFARGGGEGLLHLGAVEVEAALPPVFGFFRELGRRLVGRLCGAPDVESQRERLELACPLAELRPLILAAPPFAGAEYLGDDAFEALWRAGLEAFRAAIAAHEGTVESWLRARSPLWHLVGRVHFHLAENKGDAERPFAFLATYTAKLSAAARVQHVPLGRALGTYAGDRDALLSLLAPVDRAASASPFVRQLVDSRQIYQPLQWDAETALRFLREVPALEAAGVVVRVPDWWGAPGRLVARATVGRREPTGGLGLEALLDFSLEVALDGEPLTPAELAQLRAAGAGLVSLRGRWVEVDAAGLDAMVERLRAVQRDVAEGGLTLRQAMRLLAGEAPAAAGADASASDEAWRWGKVEAGAWLASALEAMRRPDALGDDALEGLAGQLEATLRPYQEVGVRWLQFLLRLGLGACLADDMGLGKTIQVIALLVLRRRAQREAGPRPDLIPDLLVVPASLVGNWMAELARFAPGLRLFVAHGSVTPAAQLQRAPSLEGVDLVLTTYGALSRLPWLAAAAWGVVIADEAQAIKNPGARQSRALKALRAGGRVALTGTPVENRLGELHSLFEFTNPGLLGPRRAFDAAVKKMAADPVRRYAPLRQLVAPYILRRLKSDRRVIADLPDKTEVRAYCSLTAAQAGLYQRAVEELATTLRSGGDAIARRGAVLAALLRLKQICNHPSQWLGDGRYAPDDSGKHARLLEIAEAAAARQEKLLVFTQFREMTRPLAAWLEAGLGRAGLVLHGDTPVRERKGLVDRFQGDPAVPFFVLSLKAGGTGLNLTAASHVVHFDRWWNPAVEDQATDRAYRIGQHRNVLVHKFLVRGTVEEKIDELIEGKRAVAGQVVGEADGAAALLTSMGDAELLRVVALDLDRALAE